MNEQPSRRMFLSAAAGAVAATVAGLLGRPGVAQAASIELGENHNATTATRITNDTNSNTVFEARSTAAGGSGTAISGESTEGGVGVSGTSNSSGVFGHGTSGGTGVTGSSASGLPIYGITQGQGPGVVGHSYGNGTGVMGFSTNDGNIGTPSARERTGVYGHAIVGADSRGVWGRANAGVGVFAEATTGFALRADGRVKVDRASGVATIPAGARSVTVTPGLTLTAQSFVLLTPRANIGGASLWYSPEVAANRFKIRLSSPRSRPTKVAWLLLG